LWWLLVVVLGKNGLCFYNKTTLTYIFVVCSCVGDGCVFVGFNFWGYWRDGARDADNFIFYIAASCQRGGGGFG